MRKCIVYVLACGLAVSVAAASASLPNSGTARMAQTPVTIIPATQPATSAPTRMMTQMRALVAEQARLNAKIISCYDALDARPDDIELKNELMNLRMERAQIVQEIGKVYHQMRSIRDHSTPQP